MVILFTLFFTFFIFPEFWHLLYQYREKYGCFVHFHFPKTFLLSSMYTLFFLFSSVASIWLFFLLSSLIYMFFRFSPAPPIYFVLFSICFPHSTALVCNTTEANHHFSAFFLMYTFFASLLSFLFIACPFLD